MYSFSKDLLKTLAKITVLVTIDSNKGSLPTASWPSNICVAIFLFFSLPDVCDHNSDKFRYHSIGIGTHRLSTAISEGFPQSNTDVFIFFFFWNNGHREYKFFPTLRCHVQNAVYQLQVTKTNSDVQEQTSALKPMIICTRIVSRGVRNWFFFMFWPTFPPFKRCDM